LIEVGVAALWACAALRFGASEEAALVALAGSTLIALSAIDLEHRRLPNVIVLPATAVAVVWVAIVATVEVDIDLAITAVACGVGAFALFFLIALVSGGMGMGDVKLAGFIGVVAGRFGWEVAVAAVFASFFVGGLVAIVLLIAGRAGRKTRVPFGPSMAAGALIGLFAGPDPVRAWLGL
jgi:leader peptidase (prepilin peptidase)/N-methyltransferase